MKKYSLILLIAFVFYIRCSAQKFPPVKNFKSDGTTLVKSIHDEGFVFAISPLEKKKIADHEKFVIQVKQLKRDIQKTDSLYSIFVNEMVSAYLEEYKIDPRKVSGHPDSLKFENGKLVLKLRK